MTYQLSHEVWVKQQVERVRGVLLQNMDPSREYTVVELLGLLVDFGLDYSNPEYTEIGAVLLSEGFLKAV